MPALVSLRKPLRRSISIICYWAGSKLIFENYRIGVRISADVVVVWLLDHFREWRNPLEVCASNSQFTPTSLKSTLRQLSRRGFLIEKGSTEARADEKFQESWSAWLPAAALLHYSSKDIPYVSDLGKSRRKFLVHARRKPAPPEIKLYPHSARVLLPRPETKGEFPRVLLARRTWREFSRSWIDLKDLSTLLWLTYGIQHWVKLPGSIGRVALKTSPSAGARHPTETYVAALRVRGLPRGLYHYAPDRHLLHLIKKGCHPREFGGYLAGQNWYSSASALMFMTAVFERNRWKYDDPAAYRTVILDAGHLCQTFCLTATWLGLAPFCTMALADSKVEKALGLDGVSESVTYAAGVGQRPTKNWAPWPERGVRLSKTNNLPFG